MKKASKTGLTTKADTKENVSQDRSSESQTKEGMQPSHGWTIEPAATKGFLIRKGRRPVKVEPTKELAEKYVKRFAR